MRSVLRTALAMATLMGPLAAGAGAQSSDWPAGTFRARRERAMRLAPDAILLIRANSVTAGESEPGFRQDPSFYYLTGLGNAIGAVLALDARRRESWLFVPEPRQLRGYARRLSAPYAYVRADSATARALELEHIVSWSQLEPFLDRRLGEDSTVVLRGAFARDGASVPSALLAGQDGDLLWGQALGARWPRPRLGPGPDLAILRDIKDAEEIAILRRVARASADALKVGLAGLAVGRRQRDIEAEVVAACFRGGAEGPSFWPWIMTGPNSDIMAAIASVADYHALDRAMRSGELARVDIGCTREHYSGDVGRTAPVSGQFTAEQREAWDVFISAYQAALASIRPGRTSRDVLEAWRSELGRHRAAVVGTFARTMIEQALGANGTPYWGMHGVGVASGEASIDSLRVGQVLALEPILTVNGVGLYLEDMILVTPAGAEVLTTGLPYTAAEIERLMRAGRRRR